MKRVLQSKIAWLFMMLTVITVVSCDEDTPDTPEGEDPIASFQYAIGDPNWNEVTFTNYSQDAVAYAWNFGDTEVSEEENPVHIYAEQGTYTVSLVATNEAGVSSDPFTSQVIVTDPDVASKLLTGEVSKTWKLFREGTSMSLGSGPEAPASNWAGLTNNGSRPCLYEQEFTFGADGTFTFDDKGKFWAEYGIFNSVSDVECTEITAEACLEAIAENMVNQCGDDVSAWLSGTHSFEYVPSSGQVTLTGEGAWMGIPKLDEATAAYTLVPLEVVAFTISITEEEGYDLMNLTFTMGGDYWNFYYASYNTGTEPELVTEVVVVPCDPLVSVSPTEISHTFASNDAADWALMQLSASGAGLEYGVDDPTDAGATKVGKYIRIADVQYQELQFKLDPANAINFENMSTITMDVYLPSTNAFDDANLTDNVFIGFGATTCPPDWWTDQHEYQEVDVAKDTWVTITFDLTAPDYVGNAGNGATVMDRNDLDMIYIAIGGGGHGVGGEFYIRNFVIQ